MTIGTALGHGVIAAASDIFPTPILGPRILLEPVTCCVDGANTYNGYALNQIEGITAACQPLNGGQLIWAQPLPNMGNPTWLGSFGSSGLQQRQIGFASGDLRIAWPQLQRITIYFRVGPGNSWIVRSTITNLPTPTSPTFWAVGGFSNALPNSGQVLWEFEGW